MKSPITPRLPVVGRYPELDSASTNWARTFGMLTLIQFLSEQLGVGRSRLLPAVVASFPTVEVVPLEHFGAPVQWQQNPLWG